MWTNGGISGEIFREHSRCRSGGIYGIDKLTFIEFFAGDGDNAIGLQNI